MAGGEGSSAETQANDLGSRQKTNRGGAAGEVGEGEDGAEVETSGACCGKYWHRRRAI
jgi:hypothetical protein